MGTSTKWLLQEVWLQTKRLPKHTPLLPPIQPQLAVVEFPLHLIAQTDGIASATN